MYKSGELLAPLIDFIHFKSGKKTALFCISLWKTTISPRQARDKYRESTHTYDLLSSQGCITTRT
eukprot:COSAG06_NODE_1237_length_10134_cov_17.263777_6_plen_65_part_00